MAQTGGGARLSLYIWDASVNGCSLTIGLVGTCTCTVDYKTSRIVHTWSAWVDSAIHPEVSLSMGNKAMINLLSVLEGKQPRSAHVAVSSV